MSRFAKVILFLILLIGVSLFSYKYIFASENIDGKLQDGDIIFQVSKSSQSLAIQNATKSKYSHCGILFQKGEQYYVYEAIQPVTFTKLETWIKRGEKNHYVVKRLKNAEKVLTEENKKKMLSEAQKHLSKSYDLAFEWSDTKIYCSELIWKVYKRGANVEIGKLEKLGNFDLSSPEVQKKLKERYGNKIPMDEIVISPGAIFESDLLYTIANQ